LAENAIRQAVRRCLLKIAFVKKNSHKLFYPGNRGKSRHNCPNGNYN